MWCVVCGACVFFGVGVARYPCQLCVRARLFNCQILIFNLASFQLTNEPEKGSPTKTQTNMHSFLALVVSYLVGLVAALLCGSNKQARGAL